MSEQKKHISRDDIVKQCLTKSLEVVDAVNTVPCCSVYNVLDVKPLYDGVGVIRLTITVKQPENSRE